MQLGTVVGRGCNVAFNVKLYIMRYAYPRTDIKIPAMLSMHELALKHASYFIVYFMITGIFIKSTIYTFVSFVFIKYNFNFIFRVLLCKYILCVPLLLGGHLLCLYSCSKLYNEDYTYTKEMRSICQLSYLVKCEFIQHKQTIFSQCKD